MNKPIGDWGIVYFTSEDPNVLALQTLELQTAEDAMDYMYPTDTIVSAHVLWEEGSGNWEPYSFTEEQLALRGE